MSTGTPDCTFNFSEFPVCGSCPSSMDVSSAPKICTTKHISEQELLKFKSKKGLKSMDMRSLKAAFLKGVEWPQNSIIQVAFIRDQDYSDYKAETVMHFVETILVPLINLRFVWDINPKYSTVRITFKRGYAESAVGTQALYIQDPNQYTMNLGWLDDNDNYGNSNTRNKGTVIIHEFGHLLGMIHEHSRADVDFKLNCPKVYESLHGPPNNWTCDEVKGNVISRIGIDQFNGSVYDPKSIMHYYLDPYFFCGEAPISQNNAVLSPLDIEWLQKTYPAQYTGCPSPTPSIYDPSGIPSTNSDSIVLSKPALIYTLCGVIGFYILVKLLGYIFGKNSKEKTKRKS